MTVNTYASFLAKSYTLLVTLSSEPRFILVKWRRIDKAKASGSGSHTFGYLGLVSG